MSEANDDYDYLEYRTHFSAKKLDDVLSKAKEVLSGMESKKPKPGEALSIFDKIEKSLKKKSSPTKSKQLDILLKEEKLSKSLKSPEEVKRLKDKRKRRKKRHKKR